jgi:hypothetical protein
LFEVKLRFDRSGYAVEHGPQSTLRRALKQAIMNL